MALGLMNIDDGAWAKVRINFARINSVLLGPEATPTFAGISLSGLTASRLVWTNASNALASKDLIDLIAGTENEINVADDGDGSVTIGLVDPLIASKGGTGLATITNHGLMVGSGTDAVTVLAEATNGQVPIGSTGADPVLATLTGTADQINITNDAGSITLSLPQDYDTGARPQLGGLGIGEASVGSGQINITGSGNEIRRVDMENTSDGAYARAGFIARADEAQWVMDAFGSGSGSANEVRLTGISDSEFLIWARRIGDAGDYPDLRFLVGSIELTFVAADSSVTLDNAYFGIANNNELRFYDDGANYVGFEAPALDANKIWVLPNADGGAGELLLTDGAGNLGWTATAPPGEHTHDGEILQLDAINSDGGAFAFDTTGVVTFNSGVALGVGADLTINGHVIFNTNNSYIGFDSPRITFNDNDDQLDITGDIVTTETIDASAGEVLTEDNDAVEPEDKDDGYIGVAIIDGTARVYFAVDGTMYYIDGTIAAAAEIVTGNPMPWLFWFTYTV